MHEFPSASCRQKVILSSAWASQIVICFVYPFLWEKLILDECIADFRAVFCFDF
eukprot:NODE_8538_length_513_cov_1.905172_g7475_i0.p1 GENE.NODE_8538_length_513_cov_1.905172_g7475_i0~~NODE_8538_length_513_cov_1.905172_g7475_i0.p1  ORF type:complete len:54 (+),score=6.41 NODE_8538_length_513_cov_1.905172_g7475_i0:244-405(+)